MSTRADKVQISVEMDASQGLQELGKLENAERRLVEQMDDLKKGTQAYADATAELSQTRDRLKELRNELGLQGLTMRQTRQYAAELKREWDNTTQNTEKFKELDAELKLVNASIQAQAGRLKESGTDWEKLRAEVGLAGMTLNQQIQYQKELNAAMANMPETHADFEAKAAELRNVGASVDSLKAKISEVGPSMQHVADSVGIAGMSMQELTQYQKELTAEWTKTAQGSAEYEKLNSTLHDVNSAMAEQKAALDVVPGAMAKIRDQVGLTGMSMNQLVQYQKELSAQWHNSVAGTEEFKELDTKLNEVTHTIGKQNGELTGLKKAWAGVKEEMFSMGAQAVIVGALVATGAAIAQVITASGKLSDSLANIQKTTGMTELEVAGLNTQLSKVDTRTARDELRSIAAVAGQLGIANDQILDFVKATDKLNVALGDEIQGGAEEVTRVMGGLRNVMTDIKSDDVSADMLHIGNALNVLAAEGSATAPVVADIANRIGGVGMVMGLTSGQVLGLSATMQELNITAERGGTAVVKILQHMAAAPEKFAQVTKLSAQEFRELVDTDIYGALKLVMEGAAGSASGATKLASTLDALGVDGAGASEVIAKMGTNVAMLDTKTSHAAKSLTETKSIVGEFNTLNDGFAGKLERIGKWWNGLFTAQSLQPILGGLVSVVAKLVSTRDHLDEMTTAWEKQADAVQNLTKETAPMLDRYDELSTKTVRNAGEQKELDTIIAQVAETIPTAVTAFDKYGKALGVNTTLARAYIDEQKNYLKYVNGEAITAAKNKLNTLNQEIKTLMSQLNQTNAQGEHVHTEVSDTGYTSEIKNTMRDMNEWRAQLKLYQQEAAQAEAALARLSGEESATVTAAKKAEAERIKGLVETLGYLGQIDAKIKDLKAKQELVGKVAGDDPGQILAMQKQIDALEIERQKLLGKWKDKAGAKDKKDAEKEAERKRKEHEKLLEEFYKFQEQVHRAQEKVNEDRLSEDARELQQIEQKYDELLDKAVDFSNNSILTAKERSYALLEIEKIRGAKEIELFDKKAAQLKKRQEIAFNNAKAETEAGNALRVLLAQDNLEETTRTKGAGSDEEANARVNLAATQTIQIVQLRDLELAELDKIRDRDKLSEEKVAARKEEINAESALKIKNIHKKTAEEIRQANLRAIGEAFQSVQAMGAPFFEMASKMSDNQAKEDEKEYKKKLKGLDNQLKTKLITEEKYKEQKEVLDQEYDKKAALRQKEQAEIQKGANIFNAIMNGAVAVTKALAEGGPIAGPILAGIVGAMTAVQIGLIAAEPIPEFKEGGFTANGFTGLEHQNLSQSKGGMLPGGPFLATVNEAGPEYFVPNAILSDPNVQPHVQAIEAIRTGRATSRVSSADAPAFVQGGATSTMPTVSSTPSTSGSTTQLLTEATGQAMANHLGHLTELWEEGKVIQAEVVPEQLARVQNLQTQIRKSASF